MQRCSHCGHYGRRNAHCPRSISKKSRRSQRTRKHARERNKGPTLPTECFIPEGTPRYSYEQFSDTDSIRLLVLLPGWNWQPIRCELIVEPLDHARSYEAISYVWGNEEDRGYILCHDRRLKIPWSLEHALRKFRRLRRKRILWADSICIDQDDTTERGHQVQNMSKVYEKARQVLVWLGVDDYFNPSALFQFIRAQRPLPPTEGPFAIDVYRQIYANGSKFWQTFDHLNRSGWFDRLWVFQEIGLAKAATVHFGAASVEWGILASFCDNFCSMLSSDGSELPLLMSTIAILKMAEFRNPNLSMPYTLNVGTLKNCSDNRDRVYALLGHKAFQNTISNPYSKLYLSVDYGVTYTELYESVALRILQSENYSSLYLLNHVHHYRGTILDMDVRSWVPQWDHLHTPSILAGSYSTFTAHGQTTVDMCYSERRLRVAGFVFDSIAWTSERFPPGRLPEEPAKALEHANPHPFIQMWRYCRNAGGEHPSILLEAMCISMSHELSEPEDERRFLSGAVAYAYFMGLDVSGLEHLVAHGDMGFFLHKSSCDGRRFFVTSRGWMGMGPSATEPGNDVCIFFGGKAPFVVWQLPSAGEHLYRLCGPCYITGIMEGQAVEMLEEGEFERTTFNLV